MTDGPKAVKCPLAELAIGLEKAKQAALKLRDDGSWMKEKMLLLSYADILDLHKGLHDIFIQINEGIKKKIDSTKARNAQKFGGRF